MPSLSALRGATLVSENSAAAIEKAVGQLLGALLEQNPIVPEQLVSVFFTVTPDLTALSAAKAARLTMGWNDVPLMCFAEPVVDGLPGLCIRVLLNVEDGPKRDDLNPVYINGAEQLRPDLVVNALKKQFKS